MYGTKSPRQNGIDYKYRVNAIRNVWLSVAGTVNQSFHCIVELKHECDEKYIANGFVVSISCMA